MKEIFKINYPESDFQFLLKSIENMTISELLTKISEFFSSQNELGLKINSSLVDLSKLSKQQMTSMR
jgi:hypothetical protein